MSAHTSCRQIDSPHIHSPESAMSHRTLFHLSLLTALLAGSVVVLQAQTITSPTELRAPMVGPASAQQSAVVSPEGARAVPSGIVRAANLAAAPATLPQLHQGADRRNVAWMAVGLAGLTIGLLTGGDAGAVVSITGGVVAMIGLFRYMN